MDHAQSWPLGLRLSAEDDSEEADCPPAAGHRGAGAPLPLPPQPGTSGAEHQEGGEGEEVGGTLTPDAMQHLAASGPELTWLQDRDPQPDGVPHHQEGRRGG